MFSIKELMQKIATTYLTQEWYDKLLVELNELKEVKLPATLARLKEAISQWDISENAEYDTSMSEKELIEGRIKEIGMILADVEIIQHQEGWEVRYGSTVVLVDDKGREEEWSVVGTGEVNVLNKTISFQSPVGQAIRGKQAGDTVSVRAPNRKYQLTIKEVK